MHVVVVDSLTGNDYSICLCRGLYEAGVDVALVTVEGREMPFPVAFPVYRWAPSKEGGGPKPAKLLRYLGYLTALFRYAARKSRLEGGSVVHFQFFRRPRVESLYLLLLRLSGARLVFTAHNIVPHESSRIDRWLNVLVYRTVHEIVVHSDITRRALLEQFPVPASKVHVVPHGNFDHYRSESDPDRDQARRRLGLQPDDHVCLFFGYIREYKGLDTLLEAFPAAAARDDRLRLVVAGAPHTEALRAEYTAMIQRSAYSERILFHDDFVDSEDVPVYFQAADLVVLPYKNIYHSGIIHLAYSFGKPVLATNVGDFSETIVQGRSGFVLDQNTAEALAAGLNACFQDEGELRRMGAYARELSATRYCWREIGASTGKIYRETG